MKTFSTREIAQLKRTAQNVAPMVAKREKLYAKVKELYKEMEVLDAQIDAWESGTKIMTGGYTTSDLVSRVVKEVTADDGKVTKTVSFVLKYPDTVLPPEETIELDPEDSIELTEACSTPWNPENGPFTNTEA